MDFIQLFCFPFLGISKPGLGENRQLVTDEPVEFEKDLRRITDHFR